MITRNNKKQIDRLKHKQKLLQDPATIHGFGQMSFDGYGVSQDYAKALKWYQL